MIPCDSLEIKTVLLLVVVVVVVVSTFGKATIGIRFRAIMKMLKF